MNDAYIISDNKLYIKEEQPLYTEFKQCPVEEGSPNPVWTGPKIPFELFREMTLWCEVTQEEFGSEAMVLLFLDTDKNEWKAWYPPQETCGLSVELCENDPRYKEQRKNYPDLQLGTLHHHCNISAFQSGTDSEDEKNRDGLHFTVGHLDQETFDLHARFCVNNESYDIEVETVVEMPPVLEHLPEAIKLSTLRQILELPVTDHEVPRVQMLELAKEMVDEKPKIVGYQGYGGIGGQSYSNSSFRDIDEEEGAIALLTGIDSWLPKGKELCNQWFDKQEDIEWNIDDIADAICCEQTAKGAFTPTAQALQLKLRNTIRIHSS